MTNKKILILGAGGLLGSELLNNDYLTDWDVVGHFGRTKEKNANLSDYTQTTYYLDSLKPDAIINLAGLTNVDQCEEYPNEAFSGNVKIVENIVEWIKKQDKKIKLIHISTDQVYDGDGLHTEANTTLKNYYAFSKYAGELAAVAINSTILRTNFFGRSSTERRDSFTDWLYNSLVNEKEIHVFDDVFFSPLSMSFLCEMISLAIEKDITGIYNLGSKNGLSKADFAYEFAKALGLNYGNMTRTGVNNVSFVKTYRPKNMRLDVSKFEKAVGITLPNLNQQILQVSREYIVDPT